MRAKLPVTWHHTPESTDEDEYGRPITPKPVDLTVRAIAFDPGTTSEPRSGTSRRVSTKPTMYLPDDPGLTAQDAFTVHGRRYEIDGDPGIWQSPITGQVKGVEVPMRRVTG